MIQLLLTSDHSKRRASPVVPTATSTIRINACHDRVGRPASARHAFTLIETILALGLSGALMLAVFGLVNSTATYHVTGNHQVIAGQRILGILHDLRYDLQAVESDPEWFAPAQSKNEIEFRLEEPAWSILSSLQSRERSAHAEPIRLVGEQDWLLVTLAHPNPRFSAVSLSDPNSIELTAGVQVLWSRSSVTPLTIPTHDQRGRVTTKTIAVPGGRSLLRTAVTENGSTNNPFDMSIRMVDADMLQFRYLCDKQWRTRWNSSSEKRLPTAIEMTLVISGWPETHRWLIHLPAAQDCDGEAKR
jgi:hypothetical protein